MLYHLLEPCPNPHLRTQSWNQNIMCHHALTIIRFPSNWEALYLPTTPRSTPCPATRLPTPMPPPSTAPYRAASTKAARSAHGPSSPLPPPRAPVRRRRALSSLPSPLKRGQGTGKAFRPGTQAPTAVWAWCPSPAARRNRRNRRASGRVCHPAPRRRSLCSLGRVSPWRLARLEGPES